MKYKGCIVEESLIDNRIINKFEITKVYISSDENPLNRWHIYSVNVNEKDIEFLSTCINETQWYMHFWNENRDIICVYKNKTFHFNFDKKQTWTEAIEYGLSLGIPKEQLDFLID